MYRGRVTPPPRAPLTLSLGLGIGLLGHGIAWAAYAILGMTTETQALPAWGALVYAFGGREAILAVFSLAAMLPLYAGVMEYAQEGRPRLARGLGLVCAAVALALALRWYGQGRVVFTALAGLLAVPGLLGVDPPKRPDAAPPAA